MSKGEYCEIQNFRGKRYDFNAIFRYVDECVTGLLKEEFVEWSYNNGV